MASLQEFTAQVVALTDTVQTLTNRLGVAEQLATLQQGRAGGKESGVFDQKRLYPKDLKEGSSFRSWSDRFLAWLSMDNEEIGLAFTRAGKQESPLDVSA